VSVETIARRYATALADVVITGPEAETVRADLSAFAELIDKNNGLTAVFSNPSIAHSSKENVLDELISRSKPSRTAANFLRVLLQNGRLTELGEINVRFAAVLEERSGVVSAEVRSARELADAERVEFEENLAKLTGKHVKINFTIDDNIIGGAVTRIGSKVYDGSVRTKLENLREQLVNG